MQPLPIRREGSYHSHIPDPENPSATALRKLIQEGQCWHAYIPPETRSVYENAAIHTLTAGERAILTRLRTMSDADFEALPYGSEGLWRKFMHASRSFATLEEILTAVKSKRYTRTRLDRMAMCAFLGITQEDMNSPVPYARILAFNETGRNILKTAKKQGFFLNAGERPDHPYWQLEQRTGDLYALFAGTAIEPPGTEAKRRVYYHRGTAK
jgi:predicted nucleotidyltransferase